VRLNQKAGNTKWQDSTKLEMGGKPPDGYKKIRVHLIFTVKQDGRHKSRLVADGHLSTDVPVESVYSGVVSLHGLRLVLVFLSELNGLDTWATDICNAYLEATAVMTLSGFRNPTSGCARTVISTSTSQFMWTTWR
jgi:uncharacterized membrane protein YecN with MAPEG domain